MEIVGIAPTVAASAAAAKAMLERILVLCDEYRKGFGARNPVLWQRL